MIINSPTIYTSSDTLFFNLYGISFIKSFKFFNPHLDIHYHIIDPLEKDLDLLKTLPCIFTISYTSEEYKQKTVDNLKKIYHDQNNLSLKHKIKLSFKFLPNLTLEQKFYKIISGQLYRSGRFIELDKLWSGNYPILAYDVDTLCIKKFEIDDVFVTNQACLDIKGNFVTSLTAFNNDSKLLRNWALKLDFYVKNNISFGFMDQETFINESKNFEVFKIGRQFCDHTQKGKLSYVITGKGNNKFNNDFMTKVELWKFKT